MKTVAALLALAALAGCASGGGEAVAEEADLIGGKVTTIPGALGISSGGRKACTAAQVGPRSILTAAHCVMNLGSLALHYDATHPVDVRDASGAVKTVAVATTHVHPAWLAGCAATLCSIAAVTAKLDAPDVAVIELAAPLDGPVLRVDRTHLAPGDAVVATGFGCTTGVHVTDTNVATALRSAPLTIALPDRALHEGSPVTAADEPTYDALYALTTGSAALCPGDSGGPLLRAGAVVGVNANYTLLPDAEDAIGIPVTSWHTRLDASSKHDVAGWLATVGVP